MNKIILILFGLLLLTLGCRKTFTVLDEENGQVIVDAKVYAREANIFPYNNSSEYITNEDGKFHTYLWGAIWIIIEKDGYESESVSNKEPFIYIKRKPQIDNKNNH